MPSSRPTTRQRGAFFLSVFLVACALVFWFSRTQVIYSAVDSDGIVSPPVPQPWKPSSSTENENGDDDTQKNPPPPPPVDNGADVDVSDVPLNDRPVAVLIETKIIPNLIPVMLHFATVLGPAWTLILFTLEDEWDLPLSPSFRRAVADKRIEIRFLPPTTRLTDSRSVSLFLTQPWLWEQVQSAKRALLFQLDSIICSKASIKVEDFFDYDFVGAPIASRYGEGYNGGLSLRNPRLFLKITEEGDFANSTVEFEDQWFYREAKARVTADGEEDGERKGGVKLPDEDVAKTFSVESIYYDKPLGYHQPQRWQADRMGEIEEWCPEVKMLIGRRST